MIDCPHRPPCPGCPRLGEADVSPSVRGAVEELAREAGADAPRIASGARLGFRHRARLAVRGRANSPKVGIFETGTHRVVAIPNCLVHHPVVNEVARALVRAIVATRTPPYSDVPHQGLVRYAQIVVERRTRRAQVVVVANSASLDPVRPLLDTLSATLGPTLHSLFWNGNPLRTNTILGPDFVKLAGPDAVEESIGGARVFYPPGAFGQSNLDLADEVVRTVHGWIPKGSRVLELYAGVGATGLGLLARGDEVTFNEIAPASLDGLALGIAAQEGAAQERARVLPGSAEEATAAANPGDFDAVIADPPRKGLDRGLLERVLRSPPQTFVYIACGATSFLADARALIGSRSLRLAELVVFDLFPHTEHVEIAARFERVE